MEQELSFDYWMHQVLTIGISMGLFHEETTFFDVDTEAFKQLFYDEGYCPEDAV